MSEQHVGVCALFLLFLLHCWQIGASLLQQAHVDVLAMPTRRPFILRPPLPGNGGKYQPAPKREASAATASVDEFWVTTNASSSGLTHGGWLEVTWNCGVNGTVSDFVSLQVRARRLSGITAPSLPRMLHPCHALFLITHATEDSKKLLPAQVHLLVLVVRLLSLASHLFLRRADCLRMTAAKTFHPTASSQTVPLNYTVKFKTTDGAKTGSAIFRVLNLRSPVSFVLSRGATFSSFEVDLLFFCCARHIFPDGPLFVVLPPSRFACTGNVTNPQELARSAVLLFARPNEPTGGHLALAGESALRVTWTTAESYAPAVRWVRRSAHPLHRCDILLFELIVRCVASQLLKSCCGGTIVGDCCCGGLDDSRRLERILC